MDLVKPDGSVWLLTDGDEAGVRCAHDVFEKVSPHRSVRWLPLTEGRQPTDYPVDELNSLLRRINAITDPDAWSVFLYEISAASCAGNYI